MGTLGASIPTAPLAISHVLQVLALAALLGAALGVIRPVRREIVPRSAHIVQAQILLALVGAIIIVVVAESLARAFAIVGAAGLIRYRARVDDPKDAGVMLVSLVLGLAVGGGLFAFATLACVFVIGVLWLLESMEPPARSRFDLRVAAKDAARLRPHLEHALQHKRVSFELRGSSPTELHYEVTVPLALPIQKLSREIRHLDTKSRASVEWEIKKFKAVKN